ncbi:benzoyl-CoA 2,3-epoxidase subunit BoxA [Cupriavidus pauculus]|uniref:benzoyl-CoA 2,3-epoxidase subunit BoxA n=1 Tax=Cupriavidus pauculus TaxID=82633 RepID=UPI001FD60A0E|nr:benzoyl-CoA 2,3-epoxidase subunit BoxA [Cupriavidus pauculus]
MDMADVQIIKQHLIDPEICIRCNTCEATCPVGAITHDTRNYVVDAQKCNLCMACVSPCPTGSIDNWRDVPLLKAYSIEEQLGWDSLPEERPGVPATDANGVPDAESSATPAAATAPAGARGSVVPPWSAAHPYTNLYGPKSERKSVRATVVGNARVTDAGHDYDTHHIVLDFGTEPFPVLEGQSIGVVPPGTDATGRAHHARQYSIASARSGERPGYNNLSLTIKRVLEDRSGQPIRGIASNYMCDLKVGDSVEVVGPFGATFLMPNDQRSNIVMICTGTGSAPMRAMTEWLRRQRKSGVPHAGKLMLFFGARSQEELPYFGPLKNLPKDFIDINLAYSRAAGKPKQYVQDLMRERSADLASLLAVPHTYFYVCGLKSMEEGVLLALQDIATRSGMDWDRIATALRQEGRLHLETY